jgi:hypothetical protein
MPSRHRSAMSDVGATLEPTRRSHVLVMAVLAPPLVVWLMTTAYGPPGTPTEAEHGAVERASRAIGISTGTALRGVVPLSLEDFRRGLIDGLRGPGTETQVMSRVELFARIRELTKRLNDAEIAAVAARIDRSQDS